MARDNRRPYNFVAAFAHMYFDETFRFSIENGPVYSVKLLHEGLYCDALRLGFFFIEPDVGNLRIGIGTPRDRQCTGLGPPEAQRILNYDPR